MNQVEVSWSFADADVDARIAAATAVYIVTSTANEPDRIERVDGPVSEMTVTGLKNGVAYGFTIYAATADGRSVAEGPVTAMPTTGADGEVAGLIVAFADGTDVAVGDSDVPGADLVDQVGLEVTAQVTDDAMLVELSEAVSVEQAEQIATDLQSLDEVAWAEPDVFLFTASADQPDGAIPVRNSGTLASAVSVPADAAYASDQWNLWDAYGIGVGDGNASMTNAWASGRGSGAVVAVIDTGITDHPDLRGRLVPGYDFVSNPPGLAADRDGTGIAVDFDGDYVDTARFGGLGRDGNPTDPGDWRQVAPVRNSSWHGTAIAGVIAASDNSAGVVGVAPEASIEPVRALSWRGGLLSDIAASITWASGGTVSDAPANGYPADVINMSFAVESTCPVALQAAITDARARGTVLVAAAGNAGMDAVLFAPGNCDGVLTVAATNRDGQRAGYSNYGPRVDLSAPGGENGTGSILAPSNTGTNSPDTDGATYRAHIGTSVAAAHVSGAIALLKARNTTLTPDEIEHDLTGSVRPFANDTFDTDPTKTGGTGILNLGDALAQTAGTCSLSGPTLLSTGYVLSTWTNPDGTGCSTTWTAPTGVSGVEYLVVAGGGGGGGAYNWSSGGGGAGGLLTGSTTVSAGTAYTVTVGGGGAGGTAASNWSSTRGGNGGNSAFATIAATGGGGGASGAVAQPVDGSSGGSGGGGSAQATANAAGAPGSGVSSPTRQGYDGAAGVRDCCTVAAQRGGGGGGAGGASTGQAGGSGMYVSMGGATYATGGTGGTRSPVTGNGANGTAGTGNGGGGAGGDNQSYTGGTGGSGIVLVRYAVPTAPTLSTPTATAGNTATLTWTAPSNAGSVPVTGYRIAYTPSGGSTSYVTVSSSASPYALTGLTPNTTYSFTVTANSAAGYGVTSSTVSMFVLGATTKFKVTGTTSQVAGATQSLTVTAQDTYANTTTFYTGSKSITFSGATASPNSTNPTVTNASGTATAFGTATTLTFTNGVATVSGSNNGVMRLYSAETAVIVATDGSITTSGTDRLTVTVTPNTTRTITKLTGDGQTGSPGAVLPVDPSVSVKDSYLNPVTAVTVTFSVTAGAGTPTSQTPTTNSSGIATSADWTLGTAAGTNTMTAASTGATTVSFTATASTGACAPTATTTGAYTVQTFAATGLCTWTAPTKVTSFDTLLVGGGGGGGGAAGGGGGGGSLAELTSRSVTGGSTVSVLVGAGGAGGMNGAVTGTAGRTTQVTANSTTYTAPGGSAGSNGTTGAAGSGGSGGNATQTGSAGGTYAGTTANTAGGSGTAGKTTAFVGGAGSYGGGGGGGINVTSTTTSYGPAAGGSGGGGAGAWGTVTTATAGSNGTANTGGGGGGGAYRSTTPTAGGNGGSGLVVVRYYTNWYAANSSTSFAGIASAALPAANLPSVKVTDADGNPVSGVTVTFGTPTTGSATGLSQTTDAAGVATVGGWTLGVSNGSMTATVANAGGSQITFSVTAASGCTPSTSTSSGFTHVTFTSAGACGWQVPAGLSKIDYLVVGGGGGGGAGNGGGGGGGGVLESTGASTSVTANGVVSVTVGAGGTAGSSNGRGGDGGSSSLSGAGLTTVTANGGGSAGGYYSANGAGGASYGGGGGGAGYPSSPGTGGAAGQGGAGGAAGGDNRGGGGGGALPEAGAAGVGRVGAAGGSGKTSSITGSVYGGGGGGGGQDAGGAGGSGGGGDGGYSNTVNGTAGGTNTGGGGGGNGDGGARVAGAGGSGIVLLRYALYTAPTAVTSTATASGEITLTWTAPTAISGASVTDYAVSLGLSSGTVTTTPASGTCTLSASRLARTCTVTNLTLGTTYYFTVAAVNAYGTGAASTPVSAMAVGPLDGLRITGSSSQVAGTTQSLTITAVDAGGNTIIAYTGSKTLTFSGASTAPDGTDPTVTPSGSATGIAFGSPTAITFTNGVATVTSGLNGAMTLYDAETALISVTDGTYAATGSNRLSVVVSPSPTRTMTVDAGNAQTATVGTAVSTAPSVEILDAYDNVVPGVSVTFAVGSGGGSVTGGSATTNSSGIATVGSWTLGTTTGANTVTATATGIAGSPLTFTATGTADVATEVVFSAQPSSTVAAGKAFAQQPVVDVVDQYGNTVLTDSTTQVALTASTGGTLGGTTTVTASAGTATFSGVTFAGLVASGYTLTASASGLTSDVSSSFAVTPGDPALYVVTPASTSLDAATSMTVTAQVQDAYGNDVPVSGRTITWTTTPASTGSFSNATSTNASGVATVTWTAPRAATSLTITATDQASITGTSPTVTTAQILDAYALSASGSSLTAGGSLDLTIEALDLAGNRLTTYNGTKSLVFSGASSTHGAGTVVNASGTAVAFGVATSITFTNGLATVANGNNGVLTLYTAEAAAQVVVTDSGTGSTSNAVSIAVAPAAATALAIGTPLAAPATSGAVFATQPAVKIVDQYGNTVTSSTATVTVTASAGTLGGSQASSGMTASSGVATFTNLMFTGLTAANGGSYTLAFASTGLTGVSSATFAPAAAGSATRYAVTASGGTSAVGAQTAGTAFDVRITAYDAAGNRATSASGRSVALTSNAFTGSASGTLGAGGYVDNVTLTPTVAGSNRTIDVASTSPALSTTNASNAFTVSPGTATQLLMVTQPVAAASEATFTTQPVVRIADAYGNTVTSDSTTDVIVTASGGSPAPALGGTTTVTASSGIVTFAGLTFAGVVGTTYTLDFAEDDPSPTLTSVTSATFSPTGPGPAVAADSSLTAPASTLTAGGSTMTLTVNVVDQYGNAVPGATVVMTKASGTGTLGAVTDNNDGTYTATLTSPNLVGSATFTATVNGSAVKNGTATATTLTVAYTPGAVSAARSTFTATAGSTTATAVSVTANGTASATLTVQAKDQHGNSLITGGATVKVTTTHLAGGTLSGGTANGDGTYTLHDNSDGTYTATLTAPTVVGQAQFLATLNGLQVQDGTGQQVQVIVDFVHGPLYQYLLAAPASSTGLTAGGSTNLTITAQDRYGNTVTSLGTAQTLYFSGANAAPGGNVPTVTDAAGTAVAFGTGTSVGFSSGVATVSAGVNGVLTLYAAGTAQVVVSNAASSPTVTSNAVSIAVAPAAAHALGIAQALAAPATSGALFATQPSVKVVDQYGNTVTTSTATVTVTASGGVLGGTTSMDAVAGIATFTDLTFAGLTAANTGSYTLTFASTVPTTIASVTSAAFAPAAPGSTNQYVVTMSGGNLPLSSATKTAGSAFSVRITAKDAAGNVTPAASGTSVTLTSTALASTASVSGTVGSSGYVDAVAITPTVAGSGRTITAKSTSPSITTANAAGAFDVDPGSPGLLLVMPGEQLAPGASGGKTGSTSLLTAGVDFDVEAYLADAYGNLVANNGAATSITLAVASGTGALGGTLVEPLAAGASSAIFPNVAYSRAETAVTIGATTPAGSGNADGLTATSAAFDVQPGTISAAQSTLTASTTTVSANGTDTATLTVQLKDVNGNVITTDRGATVEITQVTGAGMLTSTAYTSNGQFIATLTAPSASGTATFKAKVNGAWVESGSQTATVITVTYAALQQTVTFGQSLPTTTFQTPNEQIALTATASSGLTVTYAGTAGVCTVSGSTLTVVGVGGGTCTVTASQAGNAQYDPATDVVRTFTVNKANQAALTMTSTDTGPYLGTIALTASGGSGTGLIGFQLVSPAGSGLCAITGSTLTLGDAGSLCQVRAARAGDGNYNQVTSATQTITTTKANQAALTITSASSGAFGTTIALATSGGSGTGVVSFAVVTSSSSNPCTLSGSTLALGDAGSTCDVQATRAGDGNYNPVTSAVQQITTTKANQAALTITSTDTGPYLGTISLTTSGGSGTGAVSFAAVSPQGAGLCSVSGSTLTLGNAGSLCEVEATRAGDGNYNATTSAVQTVTITKANQTISFAALAGKTYGDPAFTLNASASSGLTVTFSSTTTGVCSTSGTNGTTLTILAAGTCSVTASQAGNANWNAATSVPQSFVVNKANQAALTITSADAGAYGTTITLTASGGSGTGAVSFAAVSPQGSGLCSVSGSTLTLGNAASLCQIEATRAGDGNYNATTSAVQTVTIVKANQVITFAAPGGKTYGDPAFSVAPSASSGLTVSLAASPSAVCSVTGTTVTITGAGTCSLTASQAGNANINPAADVIQSFVVSKASQTVSFPTITTKTFLDPAFTVSATSSPFGLAVAFTSSTPGVCTVAGTLVTLAGAGQCTLTATQGGNANVDPASASQTFTVDQANQATLTMSSPSTAVYGATITLAATGGSGTGAVSFTVAGGACTIGGTNHDVLSPGNVTSPATCKVRATKAGDANFILADSAIQTVTVTPAGQTLAFTSAVPSQPVSGGTYTPAATSTSPATGQSSGIAPVLSIDPASSAVCTMNAGVVTFLQSGACVIQADAAATTNFLAAAQVTQTVAVGVINQTITFPQPANVGYGASSATMTATASSGLLVSFTTGAGTTNSACTVSTLGVVTIQTVGVCEVVAAQAGSPQYAPASSVTRAFQVVPTVATAPALASVSAGDGSVTVAFVAPGFTGGVSVSAYEVVATPVGGGAPVSTSACSPSATPLVCTVTGLTNGQAYTATVAAVNAAGTGAASSLSGAVTPATAAFAVSNLAAMPGNTTLAVSWTPLTNPQLGGGAFTEYQVSYRSSGASAWTAWTSLTSQSATGTTITGLANATAYDVMVVAITTANAVAIPGNTAVVIEYPSTVPTAPQMLQALSPTATTLQVSWAVPLSDGGTPLTPVSAGGPDYLVQITSTDAGAVSPIACVFANASNRFCSASGLTNGATYAVSVQAHNRMGLGATATTTFTVASGNATLSALVVDSAAGAVALSPAFTPAGLAYTAQVAYPVSSVTVTPTTAVPGAVVEVDGVQMVSGQPSAPVTLVASGTTTVTILVTAPDPAFTRTYEVAIARAPAPAPVPGGGGGDLPPLPPLPGPGLPASEPGTVVVDGVPIYGVEFTRNHSDSGWDVTGPGFGMTLRSVSATDRPVEMTDAGVMRVPQGGAVSIAGNGFAPGSPVTVFALPAASSTAERSGAVPTFAHAMSRMSSATLSSTPALTPTLARAAASDSPVELGVFYANEQGEIDETVVVGVDVAKGAYVLQVNGFTPLRLQRSVNVRMDVVAGSEPRAGVVREAGFFAARSAAFTVAGRARLDALVDAIPADATNTRVSVVAVSVSMGTPAQNVRMASQRAQAIVDHLIDRGVKGEYDVTVKTTFTVDGAERTARALTDAGIDPATPDIAPDGRPLTTTTITYTAPHPL